MAHPFFRADPAGTIAPMLRRTLHRTIVIAGMVAALSMLTLSLVPPGTLGTIQFLEGYYVGHRVSVWANSTQLAFVATPSSTCDQCAARSLGNDIEHKPDCPNYYSNLSLTFFIEPPLQRWFAIPGFEIHLDKRGLYGFGFSATSWFFACLFALYPAITLILWLRARRRIRTQFNFPINRTGAAP